MNIDIETFLKQKPSLKVEESAEQTKLSKEQFSLLTEEIEKLKKRLEQGEQVTIDEARKITVWFRARRVENFTVAVAKIKAKKSSTGVLKKKRMTAEEKQQLGQALIDSF